LKVPATKRGTIVTEETQTKSDLKAGNATVGKVLARKGGGLFSKLVCCFVPPKTVQ
jgi:hypothetical protein